ncbi:hypothetical protein FPOAC2_08679 [Fusarium poae]
MAQVDHVDSRSNKDPPSPQHLMIPNPSPTSQIMIVRSRISSVADIVLETQCRLGNKGPKFFQRSLGHSMPSRSNILLEARQDSQCMYVKERPCSCAFLVGHP